MYRTFTWRATIASYVHLKLTTSHVTSFTAHHYIHYVISCVNFGYQWLTIDKGITCITAFLPGPHNPLYSITLFMKHLQFRMNCIYSSCWTPLSQNRIRAKQTKTQSPRVNVTKRKQKHKIVTQTFSIRILSPHSASMWFSMRIRSSFVTFHCRLAKWTTANSLP